MTKRKQDDSQAGPFSFREPESASARLNSFMESLADESQPTNWPVVALAFICGVLCCIVVIFLSNKLPLQQIVNMPTTIRNSVHNGDSTRTDNRHITVVQSGSPAPKVRIWADLSADERAAIKAEAVEKFPEIKNVGAGVDWSPVSRWMIEDKGVVVNSARDLFREH